MKKEVFHEQKFEQNIHVLDKEKPYWVQKILDETFLPYPISIWILSQNSCIYHLLTRDNLEILKKPVFFLGSPADFIFQLFLERDRLQRYQCPYNDARSQRAIAQFDFGL